MSISEEEFRMMQLRVTKTAQQPVPEDAVEEESELHEDIIKYCRARRWGFIHSRMDKKATVPNGTCDFVVFASRGRTFLIECKSRTGKLSPAQLAFKIQQEENGHTVHVITTLAAFVVATND